MRSAPPWEWADGDPLRSSQFAFLTWAYIFGLLVFLVILLAEAFAPTGSSGRSAESLVWVMGAELVFIVSMGLVRILFARWYPVIARLGISPLGLKFRMGGSMWTPLRRWGDQVIIGPNWVGIQLFGLTDRYRLTDYQIARVRGFARLPNDPVSPGSFVISGS